MKTNESNACPKCGAAVPPEAPEGLCPKCVLAVAASSEPAPTATSQIPSLEGLSAAFPQLQIIEMIGRGGMGFVFKARQPHLDRFVALKLLPESLAHDAHFAERFNREGRTLARLNHPNIVSVFDFGYAPGAPVSDPARGLASAERAGSETGAPPRTPDASPHPPSGFFYLLMEYVDGVNLRQAMQAGRFSPNEALSIVPKICEALQYAHEEGVLHRDIKPENILLDSRGRVKIADFGIAKIVGEDKPDLSLTATGATLGTPHYMAPEQFEHPGTVDHRADIYSLGVVFYEMLTGELPIGRFAAPSAKTPLDQRIDEIVFRALEKEREKRFQSAGEVKTTVEHVTESGSGVRPSSPPPSAPVEDFILCHPRLPRMAQFITVFALVLVPALWFIGLMTIDTSTHPNVYAEFVQSMTTLVNVFGELLTTVLIFIGGWKLRALKKSGPRIISVGLWLNMLLIAFNIGSLILIENLAPTPEGGDKPMPAGEAMLGALQFAALAFHIVALVWLHRNRAVLNNIFQSNTRPPVTNPTVVIKPGDVVPVVPAWSLKAVWSAVLTGLSLPLPSLMIVLLYLRAGGMAALEIFIAIVSICLPGLAGTILGWMGLSDIRAHEGKLRGLPLALFGALALPLFVLVAGTLVMSGMIAYRSAGPGPLPFVALPMFLVPAGSITFAIWAVYAAARWAGNRPPSERRGVLKWVFLALMVFAAGAVILPKFNPARQAEPPVAPAAIENSATPSIRFTITAVELREENGVRWLAIDYLDQVQGECEKSFPWESTIQGFKPATRASEFAGGTKESPVRHQRIEYRMPDEVGREPLEQWRDSLARALKQQTIRLEMGEEKLLFEVVRLKTGWAFVATAAGQRVEPPTPGLAAQAAGSLKARIKVGPPLETRAAAMDRRIDLAREQLEVVQKRVSAGVSSQQELAMARRELELAEARGDAVKEAWAKLKFAESEVEMARKQFQAGIISSQQVRAAESRHAQAEIDVQQASKPRNGAQP